MTSTLQSMVVVTSTHFTLELHWKCQYSLEKYQEAGASMEILPLNWIYENFYCFVDLLAWRQWGKSWRLELIVCFILKVIFPVHHFRDLQNRLKDSLKRGKNQYLDILQTRRYCGIPFVQDGITVNTTVMLFAYKVFCRYWKKKIPKNYLTKSAQNSLEESYMCWLNGKRI